MATRLACVLLRQVKVRLACLITISIDIRIQRVTINFGMSLTFCSLQYCEISHNECNLQPDSARDILHMD